MTRIVLHIDQLELRGIDHADVPAVAAGIRKQLKALLVEPNVVAHLLSGGDRFRIKAGTPQVDQAGGAVALGRNIGGKIAKGVTS